MSRLYELSVLGTQMVLIFPDTMPLGFLFSDARHKHTKKHSAERPQRRLQLFSGNPFAVTRGEKYTKSTYRTPPKMPRASFGKPFCRGTPARSSPCPPRLAGPQMDPSRRCRLCRRPPRRHRHTSISLCRVSRGPGWGRRRRFTTYYESSY